ncbi:hypothetical protein F4808DRAFT_225710 [Astrocystis sublimbata]|nr:hypothetical protein F4808DRAFT_225710 [Astrocystis sublimbata]
MLGWALKKGFQGATGLRDAPEEGPDTAQFDAPDTPAPVFAARAIKNAIWGQPATATTTAEARPATTTTTTARPAVTNPKSNGRVGTASNTAAAATSAVSTEIDKSPSKPNSILLTPGTGASRRKRVSFGRDVKTSNSVENSPSSARSNRIRKKTTLQQALERSRPTKAHAEEPEEDGTEDEDEWEDEDVCCSHEPTVDLNEPHSESGKYWKAEWSRYREEAKSDIEQLVKYKANAKSYAAKKDTEASRLSQQLREEHAKMVEMEAKIVDLNAKLAADGKHGAGKDNASTAKDLARQTSLVSDYRERVKELEIRLQEATTQSSLAHRINTSPRTEQNIIEVSRELRKARTELRQMDRLRDEVKRLKSNLATSREQAAELAAQAAARGTSESAQVERLEKQLREAREESRQKDADIRKLKRDYETLKRDAKTRTGEAMQVLQDKNNQIAELENKVKDLEAVNASKRPKCFDATIAEHSRITRDLKSDIESLSKPSKYEWARPISRHTRAASVEEMTLDMTQRSLLMDTDNHVAVDIRRTDTHGTGLLTDWTADIPTFDLQGKDYTRQAATAKLNAKPAAEDAGESPTRRATRGVEKRPLNIDQRAVSDVLANRVNESTRRRLRRNETSEAGEASTMDHKGSDHGRRARSGRAASLAEDKATMHGAMDPSPRRPRPESRIIRPASPDDEAPVIDLVQDRFSRLGGPSADRSAVGNTSRCTLPADRLAAARARLEKKKLERRKTSGHGLDKENLRP